jgi:hypothetical protein
VPAIDIISSIELCILMPQLGDEIWGTYLHHHHTAVTHFLSTTLGRVNAVGKPHFDA